MNKIFIISLVVFVLMLLTLEPVDARLRRRRRRHHQSQSTNPRGNTQDKAICIHPEFNSLESDMCYGIKVPKTNVVFARDISCGMWENIEELASACHHDTKCDAFTTINGNPWCMKSVADYSRQFSIHDHDLYHVRKTVPIEDVKEEEDVSLLFGLIFFLLLYFSSD